MFTIITPLTAISVVGCRGTKSKGGLPSMPRILSAVSSTDGKKVTITWDRPMEQTCSIKNQLSVIINGVPSTPTSISLNGDKLELTLATDIAGGDAVTWKYDDTGVCILHELGNVQQKASGGEFSVTNKVPAPVQHVRADTTWVTADSTIYSADKGA